MSNIIRQIYVAAQNKDLGLLTELLLDVEKAGNKNFSLVLQDYLNNVLSPKEYCECVIQMLDENPLAVGQKAPDDGPLPNSPAINQH